MKQGDLQRLLGHDQPFPWQHRLGRQLLSEALPSALDIPTGLGKTSVMAIWLWATLEGAKLPRRLIYVVDRRVVVDQATREAEALRQKCPSLYISTLRGQFADNREWLRDPATPTIVIGTVDMIGSRLLFSGYGAGRGMRPVHAGMLGQDTLFVLDEAHLVPPFEALLRAAVQEPRLRKAHETLPGVHLLSLSATQRGGAGNRFELDAADEAHPVVAQRIGARKLLAIETVEGKSLVDEMVGKIGALIDEDPAARVVLFCDARKDAVAVEAALAKAKTVESADRIALLTGARRVHEREDAAAQLAKLGFTGDRAVRDAKSAILIATSAGEVGVDFDADHAVMDLVPWERMVQRLGRVNRRGEHPGAQVMVLDAGADAAQWAKRSGADPEAVRMLLGHLERDGDAALCGPQALRAVNRFETLIHAASTKAPLRPALDRATLDAWSMTALREHTGRPEIAPWLRGWVEDDWPQCAVIWRRHLPPEEAPKTEIERLFHAAAPHLSEKLETEAYKVSEWLGERSKEIAKLEGMRVKAQQEPLLPKTGIAAIVLAADGTVRDVLDFQRFNQLSARDKTARDAAAPKLDNATLIVSAQIGGLSEQGMLDAAADGPAGKTAEKPDWGHELPWRIVLHEEDTEPTLPNGATETFRLALEKSGEEVSKWLIVGRIKPGADEESGAARGEDYLGLDRHHADVERQVGAICGALGLSEALTTVFRIAARLHDLGKAARIWQDYARAPNDKRPVAKSPRFGDPKELNGYRHEFGSLLQAVDHPDVQALPADDRDLVLHLIASHHGHARPFICPDGGDNPAERVEAEALEAALRFARLQERWGPWGLAWLESILRAADRAASETPSWEDADG